MKKKPRNPKATTPKLSTPKRAMSRAHKKIKPHAKKVHGWYKTRNIFQKILIWLLVVVMLFVGSMYGIARWYMYQNNNKPLHVGVTYIPRYARYYDLDAQQTMRAMIDELNIKHFRLVSYWDDYEKVQGKYDFSDLDWQFKYAEKANAKVSLAIGLRQPRWPECHMPKWAMNMPREQWQPLLKEYMKAVIERYKNSPALESYQLENEFFMDVFGECPDFSRDRLVDEFNFVKQLDPSRPVIISRSNNAVGLPINEPRADIFAVSIYKRVWDKTITKRYFEYPFPAWFYGFLAGAGKIVTGRDMIIHELQAEPWAPTDTKSASLEEQDKSLNAERLKGRFEYGRATGMKEMYLWGAEWWYWRKVKFGDSSIWDTAREEIQRLNKESRNCPTYYDTYQRNPEC